MTEDIRTLVERVDGYMSRVSMYGPTDALRDSWDRLRAALLAASPELSDAERTVKSIATMLGWMNVPPREMLERDIAALKARVRGAPEPTGDVNTSDPVDRSPSVPVSKLRELIAKVYETDGVSGGYCAEVLAALCDAA